MTNYALYEILLNLQTKSIDRLELD